MIRTLTSNMRLARITWCRAPRWITVVLLAALVGQPTTAEARRSGKRGRRVDRAVEQALERHEPRLRVIVRTRQGRRTSLAQTLRKHGDAVTGEHASINALTVDLHADDIGALLADEGIESVSIDAHVSVEGRRGRKRPIGASDQAEASKYMKTIRETLGLGRGRTGGRGIGVAVIDTGIEPAPDLERRITAFFDFTRGGIATAPYDDHGHGTHVASLIGSDGRRRSGYTGIAPDVSLIGMKVLDADGGGYTSDVIAALELAVAQKDQLGIDIINLSLGHPIFEPAESDPLVMAVEAAVRAGIVVVASAGNYGRNEETGEPGYAGITSPGNAPSALTVGAVDTADSATRADDRVPSYSSRGPTWYDGYAKPDIVAPGDALIADTGTPGGLYGRYPTLRRPGPYGYYFMALSGTSMAAGIASGVVAHVLKASADANRRGPALTPNAVKAIMEYTAIPVLDKGGLPYDALTQGAGQLNAQGATDLAGGIDTSAPVGSYWLTQAVDPYTTIDKVSYAWAQHIVWGEHVVWGETVFNRVAAWARNIVWGNARNVVWGNGYNVVWGENIVWGNAVNIVWGNHIVWGEAFNVVWGNARNVVWGEARNIVWGNVFRSGLLNQCLESRPARLAIPASPVDRQA